MSAEVLRDRLRRVLDGRVETNWPLARYTTYRLGGAALLYVEPAGADDLEALVEELARHDDDLPLLVMGRGSNLVVSDEGWPGVVVRPGAGFSWLAAVDDASPQGRAERLRAGSATSMPLLANWAARRGFRGLEFAIAIPGSVGGAVRMNAGAHGTETADSLASATIFDFATGRTTVRAPEDLHFSYRRSSLHDSEFVVSASWALEVSDADQVRERMESFRKHRAATQPGAVQNAGSVFKNPSGDSAGRLVEAAGLKGWRVGHASVSTLHANFFIAEEGSTAQDVFDLVHAVRLKVRADSGIDLEPEIRFVGAYKEPNDRVAPAGTP